MNRKSRRREGIVLGAVMSVAFFAAPTSVDAKGPPPRDKLLSCPAYGIYCGLELEALCDEVQNAYDADAGPGEKSLSARDTNGLIVKSMSIDEKLLAEPPKYADALEKVIAIQDTVCQLVQQEGSTAGGSLPGGCGDSKKAKIILDNAERIYGEAVNVLSCINDMMMPLPDGFTETEPTSSTEVIVTEPASTTEVTVTEPVATEPAATEPAATEPAATEPAATEPAATEPAATEPAVTEPAVTEPAATEPVATEPVATEPVATEPVATEPVATEPVTEVQPTHAVT